MWWPVLRMTTTTKKKRLPLKPWPNQPETEFPQLKQLDASTSSNHQIQVRRKPVATRRRVIHVANATPVARSCQVHHMPIALPASEQSCRSRLEDESSVAEVQSPSLASGLAAESESK